MPERDSQASLSWFNLLFWNNCIGTRLVSRKKQLSTSHHRKQLLDSFLEGFLKPYLQNCSWITPLNLAKQARRIEEVLACTQTPVEQVTSVESSQEDSRLDTLFSELNELKVLLQRKAHPERPEDVNVLSAAQSAPRWSTPQNCFSCGSTTHFQKDCVPPVRGRGRGKGRFYCGSPRGRRTAQTSITCCGGMGHMASQCSSSRLN